MRDDERCLPFVDCLLTHRYYVPHCMTRAQFAANVAETAALANAHNLPWCVTECSWGAWDDLERAKNIPALETFLEIGAGIVPYILHESPVMDAHGKDAGIHYGWGAPEDLCFIRRDGSLRQGHEAINDLMAKYPAPHMPPASAAPCTSFRPGARWLDTDGNPIQAHGGGILRVRDTWYWYGENKDAPTTQNSRGVARTPLTGVSCYASQDLYNWTYQGLALSAVPEDGHELHPDNVLERPKVLYNDITGKYVMWFHLDAEDYAWARGGVAIADSATGPFTYLGSMRPSGQMLRDMTLFKDDDGSGLPDLHRREQRDHPHQPPQRRLHRTGRRAAPDPRAHGPRAPRPSSKRTATISSSPLPAPAGATTAPGSPPPKTSWASGLPSAAGECPRWRSGSHRDYLRIPGQPSP